MSSFVRNPNSDMVMGGRAGRGGALLRGGPRTRARNRLLRTARPFGC